MVLEIFFDASVFLWLINIAFLQTKNINVTKICSHCPAVLD